MAIIKLDGGYNALPISYKRGNPIPLDTTSVWYDEDKLKEYAKTGATAYVGQVVSLVNASTNIATAYIIINTAGDLEPIGTAPVGDNATITVSAAGEVAIKGFIDAPVGAQLVKGADGSVEWKVPSTDTVDGLKTNVQTLLDTVNGVEASEGVEAKDGLVQKVAKNTQNIKANTDAIAVLNGDATKEGSVAYQIAQIVGDAGESFDTLKEIADWIAEHPTDAAEYNTRITANEEAIADLEDLVGTTAVATQIANKVEEALFVEGIEKYALASALTTLAGRVTTVEGKVTTIENQLAADPLHTHNNKTELDKVAAGDVAKWNEAAEKANTVSEAIATQPLHTHSNKTVLDGITAVKVAAWDVAEANAKTYVDNNTATKAQGELADTALQTVTILGHNLTKDNHTLSEETIKEELGLGSAAYENITAFDAAGSAAAVRGDTTETVASAYALAESKATMTQVNAAIAGAGHASAVDLTNHINNAGDAKHVTSADITKWDLAATLVGQLTGNESGSLGSIQSTIDSAIATHAAEADAKYATKTQTATDIAAAKKEVADSLAETDVEVAENTAAIATLQQKDAAFETRIAALEGSKEDYKAADATLKSSLEGQIAAAEGTLTTAIATAKSEAIKDAKDYADELKATILGDNDKLKDTYDTLSEISEWIETHGTAATDLASALAAETKAREDEDKAIDERLDVLELYDHSAYIAADEVLKTDLEGQISTAKTDLTAAIATAKSEAVTAAANDAATKVNTLRDGAVKTNTDNISENTTNIAANAANIETLTSTKADKGDSYLKAETYTKAEVEALIAAGSAWGSF